MSCPSAPPAVFAAHLLAALSTLLGAAVCAAAPPLQPPYLAAGVPEVVVVDDGDTADEQRPTVQSSWSALPGVDQVGIELGKCEGGRDCQCVSDGGVLPPLFTPRERAVSPEPPVLRGQSPDAAVVQLVPLVGSDATPVQTTSWLGAVSGSSGRVRGDYLTDFDGTSRIGGNLLTFSKLGFGLDAEANYWRRPVAGLGREPLYTGDVNLIYSFPPHPRMKLRSGVGPNFRIDDGKAAVGANITHGIDVYLLWRFMATGELDWGWLNGDKLFRYRLALGLTWKQAEIFTGYESYKLGDERLGGWVNGIAIWY